MYTKGRGIMTTRTGHVRYKQWLYGWMALFVMVIATAFAPVPAHAETLMAETVGDYGN